MFEAYLLVFSRITLAFLFLYSSGRKLQTFREVAVTVSDFKLFPRRWSKTIARCLLGSEMITAILLLSGGKMVLFGSLLAMVLLVAFSLALEAALWRNIKMSCHCFGRTEQRISHYDVVRNGLFIGCSLPGLWMLASPSLSLPVGDMALLALMSFTFLLLAMHLRDIVETLLRPFLVFEERR